MGLNEQERIFIYKTMRSIEEWVYSFAREELDDSDLAELERVATEILKSSRSLPGDSKDQT